MASQDVYNASKGSFAMYGGLLKSVAEEFGLEKALELHSKQGESFGTGFAEALKQPLGDEDLDIETLYSVMKSMLEGFGIDAEIESGPRAMSIKITDCPIYDGCREAGIDHETIGKMCHGMASTEYAKIREFFPNFDASVKFKDSPEDYCLEKYTLAE